jgi:Zn-finger nucleic acid-binding protein
MQQPALDQELVPNMQCESNPTSPDCAAEMGPCPVCRAPLEQGVVDEFTAWYCPQFHGMLMGQPDFGDFIQRQRQNYQHAEEPVRPLNTAQLLVKRNCPSCGNEMEVHPYYGPGTVVLDSCASCRVVWVDDGESTRIIRAPGRRMR